MLLVSIKWHLNMHSFHFSSVSLYTPVLLSLYPKYMDHEGDTPPPFWFQPTANTLVRQRRRSSSPTLNPVALIILVPILTLLILFLIVPPFLSHTSQILRPNSVKKGWDSLNVVLVLFAILCGVFLKQNDDASLANTERLNNVIEENVSPSSSSQWFDDYSDRKVYNDSPVRVPATGGGKLRRSSSSYPDLRKESLWKTGNSRSRFYDDFDLNVYRSSASEYLHRDSRRSEAERDYSDITVDTFVSRFLPPSAAPPLPPSPPLRSSESPPKPQAVPPPSRPVKLKRRRSVRSIAQKQNVKRRNESNYLDKITTSRSPPRPPPPSPPPTAPCPPPPEDIEMLERKKSGTSTKEIALAIASLYNRSKKKKHKTRNIYDDATAPRSPTDSSIQIPPSPPPPPPPPSVFQNMFKKGNKKKRIHSVSPSVQPPPPPPNSIFNTIFKNSGKSKRLISTSVPPPPPPLPQSPILNNLFYSSSGSPPPPQRQSGHRKPPLPTKASNYYENIGSQSPMEPAPPPPPPFKLRQLKFKARGNYLRISNHSSRCSSPELEDDELPYNAVDGGADSVFCPSPDVNTKADNFIARLKDEWRLEKMNSMKGNQ